MLRALVVVVALAVVAVLDAGCGAPGGPTAAGPSSGSCSWTAPSADPSAPVPVCGVAPRLETAPLDHGADLFPATIELSTTRTLTCPPATAECSVEDGHPPVGAGGSPVGDPSRSRGVITLDWVDHQATLREAPRCRVPKPPDPATAAGPLPQTCVSAPAAGFRVTTAPDAHDPWRFAVRLTLPGDPGEGPTATVDAQWQVALDPTSGDLDLTGTATDPPAVTLSVLGTVACSDPGVVPSSHPVVRSYSCHAHIPSNP